MYKSYVGTLVEMLNGGREVGGWVEYYVGVAFYFKLFTSECIHFLHCLLCNSTGSAITTARGPIFKWKAFTDFCAIFLYVE